MKVIILAGGRSQRSGRRHKACRLIHGRPWLAIQLKRLRHARLTAICVVGGYRQRLVWRCATRPVVRRINGHPEQGPYATLLRGLQGLGESVLILPLDCPVPDPPTLYRLRHALRRSPVAALWPPVGPGGHPVALSLPVARQLMRIAPASPEARLDRQLRVWPMQRVITGGCCGRGVPTNLNTVIDFIRFRRRHPRFF